MWIPLEHVDTCVDVPCWRRQQQQQGRGGWWLLTCAATMVPAWLCGGPKLQSFLVTVYIGFLVTVAASDANMPCSECDS
jgi:hypothetical protein